MALDDATGIAIFSSVGGLIALLVIGSLIWKCKKRQRRTQPAQQQQQAVQMQPQTGQPMAVAVAVGKAEA